MAKKTYSFQEDVNQAQTVTDQFKAIFRKLKKDINCMYACQVLSVDQTLQQVDLKILSKDVDDSGNLVDFPVIPNVPIRKPYETSQAFIYIPVQVGDIGTIEFFDSSYGRLKTNDIVEWDYDEDYHSLSNGLYTSGFYGDKRNYIPLNPTNPITIGLKNNLFELTSDNLLLIVIF